MEIKEIKINCPEGYEIDEQNSTLKCIKFKPVKKEFPNTWKKFCETYPTIKKEYYVSTHSEITSCTDARDEKEDKNLLPSKELAEAMLALCQLIQLRDCYNDGWKPTWTNHPTMKSCININNNDIFVSNCRYNNHILVFKTEEICNQFFENFKDLIEIAKPLL